MLKKWLDWLNVSIVALFAVVLLTAFGIEWQRPSTIPLKEVQAKKTALPKQNFSQEQKAYDSIGEPVLTLEYHPPKMQLPDLRQQINYYGQNGRPDADSDSSLLHFSIGDSKEVFSVLPGEPLYLVYDKDDGMGKYHFSRNNRETSLWVIAHSEEKNASMEVHMRDENGELVASPDIYAQFQVKEKEFARFGGASWELGKWRVDGTLLARQRARWYGIDRFLERHGGEEYKDWSGKNRIDFGDKDLTYSVYVGEGSTLVWNGEVWEAVKPGKASKGLPLLVVKKVDDRLMNLELWDPDGKKKIALNLLKSMETWLPKNVQQDFKFLGARTRSQFVFEVDDEKMFLSPNDWLLLTEEGWKKLDSAEEVDQYVERNEIGTLFVFDGVIRAGEQQVLKGTIFNASRTQIHDVELPVQKDGLVYSPTVDNEHKRRGKGNLKQKTAQTSFANTKSLKEEE